LAQGNKAKKHKTSWS